VRVAGLSCVQFPELGKLLDKMLESFGCVEHEGVRAGAAGTRAAPLETRQIQAGNIGEDSTGNLGHLLLSHFLRFLEGFVHRGEDQVFQHVLIFASQHFPFYGEGGERCLPLTVALTIPPPASPTTVLCSSSSCTCAIFSCIFWICFIIRTYWEGRPCGSSRNV